MTDLVKKEPSKALTRREQLAVTLQMEVSELSDKEAESLLVGGNLAMLSSKTQLHYYAYKCERMGLNPADRPLEFMIFQNKKILYAKKECAEMLGVKHGVAVEVLRDELTPDFYTIYVRARMPDKRFPDGIRVLDNLACLPIGAANKAEVANIKMKCQSKALRRATLAITGCGLSDSEDALREARVVSGKPSG